jgi:hypothetical protein
MHDLLVQYKIWFLSMLISVCHWHYFRSSGLLTRTKEVRHNMVPVGAWSSYRWRFNWFLEVLQVCLQNTCECSTQKRCCFQSLSNVKRKCCNRTIWSYIFSQSGFRVLDMSCHHYSFMKFIPCCAETFNDHSTMQYIFYNKHKISWLQCEQCSCYFQICICMQRQVMYIPHYTIWNNVISISTNFYSLIKPYILTL